MKKMEITSQKNTNGGAIICQYCGKKTYFFGYLIGFHKWGHSGCKHNAEIAEAAKAAGWN